jgi:hypothetical protein
MNIPDHISEIFLLVKILKLFGADTYGIRDPEIFLTLDPGSRMKKFGSGINIPDWQYCSQVLGTEGSIYGARIKYR